MQNRGCNNYDINDIYNFLGQAIFEILQNVEIPAGHILLENGIIYLMNGCELPDGHPSLADLIKLALGCE